MRHPATGLWVREQPLYSIPYHRSFSNQKAMLRSYYLKLDIRGIFIAIFTQMHEPQIVSVMLPLFIRLCIMWRCVQSRHLHRPYLFPGDALDYNCICLCSIQEFTLAHTSNLQSYANVAVDTNFQLAIVRQRLQIIECNKVKSTLYWLWKHNVLGSIESLFQL